MNLVPNKLSMNSLSTEKTFRCRLIKFLAISCLWEHQYILWNVLMSFHLAHNTSTPFSS